MGRSPGRTRKVFLEVNGPGPWTCAEPTCTDGLVHRLGKRRGDGHLHHKDHDVTNDVPDNIEVRHGRCHLRHHFAGEPKTPEHRAKIGARHKGRVFTPEWRAKLVASSAQRGKPNLYRGVPRTAETRARMRKPKKPCPSCGRLIAQHHLNRHQRIAHL